MHLFNGKELLFNVFSDCSAYETLEKYLSKKFQLTKNSLQCKLWKIVSNRSFIPLFTADAIGNAVSLSLTDSLSYLSWRCSE